MYNKTDLIPVIIARVGFIPHLQTWGPIYNPIKIPAQKCLEMVTDGVDVREVDLATKAMVKLTIENVFNSDKFNPVKEVGAPKVTEVKVTTSGGVKVTPKKEIPVPPPVVDEPTAPIVDESPVTEDAPVDTTPDQGDGSDDTTNSAEVVEDDTTTEDTTEGGTVETDEAPTEPATAVGGPAPIVKKNYTSKKKR
jgi:hypothetical protein